jgi:hypothetical protein
MFISDFAIKRKPVITIVSMLSRSSCSASRPSSSSIPTSSRRAAADRGRGDPVPRRVARRRRARGDRPDRGGHLRHQRRRQDHVELARQLRRPSSWSSSSRRTSRRPRRRSATRSRDPQRPAARDGRADPDAVRPQRLPDRVADALVADAHGARADAAGRSRHHARAARHPGRGRGQRSSAASSAS